MNHIVHVLNMVSASTCRSGRIRCLLHNVPDLVTSKNGPTNTAIDGCASSDPVGRWVQTLMFVKALSSKDE